MYRLCKSASLPKSVGSHAPRERSSTASVCDRRRKVRVRAHPGSLPRDPRSAEELREPEFDVLDDLIADDYEIRALDVPVNDVMGVSLGKAVPDLPGELDGELERDG